MILNYKVRLEGVTPLIMHSSALVDPENPFTAGLKEVNAKRSKKTEADLARGRELEWFGGLYTSVEPDRDTPATALALPEEVLAAVIAGGARRVRKGKDAQSGVFVLSDHAPITFAGIDDMTLGEMYEDSRFRYLKPVAVQRQRVMRMRSRVPHGWRVDFDLGIVDDVANPKDVLSWLEEAGRLIGIGDRRPRYGRFNVIKWEKAA